MQKFMDGAMRLIDSRIGIGVGASIGICYRNAAEWLSRCHARLLAAFQPELIPKRIVFVGISVRPTVHCDGRDVSRGIEAALAKRSRELITDIAFKRFEGCVVKVEASGAMLLAGRQTGTR